MAINVSITTNLLEMDRFLSDLETKVIVDSMRVAINRTLTSTRKEAIKELRTRLAGLKSRDLKTDEFRIIKAKRSKLNSLKGTLKIGTDPMPMLKFVKGHKNIIKQKGIKVRKRRKIRVEIQRGKKFYAKGAFIQKVHSKQLFRMGDNGGFKAQKVPSIGHWIEKPFLKKNIIKSAERQLFKTFKQQHDFRLQKAINKYEKKMRRLP